MEILKNAEFEAKCAEMANRNNYNLSDIVFIDKDGKHTIISMFPQIAVITVIPQQKCL